MSQNAPGRAGKDFSQAGQDDKTTRVLSAEDIEMFREAGIDIDSPAPQRDPRLDDPNISQKRYRELRSEL